MYFYDDASVKRYKAAIEEYKGKVILCLESAVIHSVGIGHTVRVFSPVPLDVPCFDVIVVPDCMETKETVEEDGVLYTSERQTLLDLLDYESIVDPDWLSDAWSDYYYSNGETFQGLASEITGKRKEVFLEYKEYIVSMPYEGYPLPDDVLKRITEVEIP